MLNDAVNAERVRGRGGVDPAGEEHPIRKRQRKAPVRQRKGGTGTAVRQQKGGRGAAAVPPVV